MINLINFPDFRRILGKKLGLQFFGQVKKVYIKLTIIQGKNLKPKGEKLKTHAKKTQGFGEIKNAVCRKSVEKKAVLVPHIQIENSQNV